MTQEKKTLKEKAIALFPLVPLWFFMLSIWQFCTLLLAKYPGSPDTPAPRW
ncbi:MAG: hypothetical protein ACTSU5_19105 [Promethearchaeota archaeon]